MNRQRSAGGGSRAGSVSGASVRSDDRASFHAVSLAMLARRPRAAPSHHHHPALSLRPACWPGARRAERAPASALSSRAPSPPPQETNAQKAAACARWILTMLQVKQVLPEAVTSEEMGPLLGLMYSFPKVEEVQEAGAEALALIAVDESEQSKLAPEDLVEEGAITVLLTAMKTHRNNAHLQEQAGSALLHMASRSGDVAVEIRQAGGQKAIQAAIKLHPVRHPSHTPPPNPLSRRRRRRRRPAHSSLTRLSPCAVRRPQQLKYLRTYLDELLQDSSPGGRLQLSR